MYIHLSVHLFMIARINAFIYIYIYTHTNALCLYVYVYVYVHLCVISKVGFLKNIYYFTVKIEMMVFSNFVPVIVNVFSFGHFFLPWL